jgi:hypothetical protein
VARGKDESNNPKRRPTRGYSKGTPDDALSNPDDEKKLQELFDRLDKLAGYGKANKKFGYPETPNIGNWGLDWPED